jgi:hypothetical protein
VFFLLAIVLSVLRYTDSDCPFGIFKLFLRGLSVIYNAVPTPLVAPVKPNIVNVYQNTVIVLATHVSI